VAESKLDELLASGAITPETRVWHEGMADWKPLRDARPGSAVPPVPPPVTGGAEGQPPAGFVRCSLTGKIIPESEAVYIQGKPYSAEAKPAVLQSVQQSGTVPVLAGDRTGPPGEQRAELGLFTAAWETIKGVLTKPSETFANMKREGGLGSPLLFNVIFGSAGAIAGLVYQILVNAATGAAAPTPPPGSPDAAVAAWMSSGGMVVLAVIMPLLIALGAFITAGITHLSLMICQGAKQPFETTFRVYNYASGSSTFLQVIPICGAIVGGIWGLVVMCIGLAKAHEISTGRAVLAVLLPTVVCCAIVAIGVASFAGIAAAASQGAMPTVD
jgi:hypothetical protein